MLKNIQKKILLIVACLSANIYTHATSDEWSKRWAASESRSNSNLVTANLVRLAESDYYDNAGKVTNNTVIEEQNNISNIGQNTNTIGSVNNSTTNVSVNGSNVNTNVSNNAKNTGNLNGSISTTTQSGTISQCMNLNAKTTAGSSCQ